MGSTSGIGIAGAARTRALAALTILTVSAGAAPIGSLEAQIEGFRSTKGVVHACLTTRPERFPDCQNDPDARRMTLPTGDAGGLHFGALPSGSYALALIHDENGNGRLDTVMGIPREGFGFSRNPAVRFGPPRFAQARVAVTTGAMDETIRMRYLF